VCGVFEKESSFTVCDLSGEDYNCVEYLKRSLSVCAISEEYISVWRI
jgi:hypothetical protein